MKNAYKEFFHVHTYRCGHAENKTEKEYIEAAINKSADGIYFTDHGPFPNDPFGNRMQYADINNYLETLILLKSEYEGQIDVKIGFEIEYLPSFQFYYQELLADSRIDALILGQHFSEISPGQYSFAVSKDSEYLHISESIIAAIQTGYFKYIAHPDRCFRYQLSWSDKCTQISSEMIHAAEHNNIVLEKNISSIMTQNYYRPEFWKLLGGKNKIIYGLDAHSINEMIEYADFINNNK